MSHKIEMQTYPGYGDSLLQGFKSLYDSQLLCDLTLVAEDKSFLVHKTVMAASSDYFRALLTLDMKERTQDMIHLKGVPAAGLRLIISFAYTGKLPCSLENISDILIAATHLQLREAIELCNNYLEKLTDKFNCVDMYSMSEGFNLVTVKEKALGLILTNFEEIAERDDYFKFDAVFLAKILHDDRLKVSSEAVLFQHVLEWINFDKPSRKKDAFLLLSNIRFPLIPPHDFVNTVMNQQLMKKDLKCLDLILEANKYHMLPDKQPSLQSPRTQVRTDRYNLVMLDVDEEGPKGLDLASRAWHHLNFSHGVLSTFHAQVCVLDNYMYVCGGIELYSSTTPVSAKCYRYDPRFDNWTSISAMQHARHHFSLVSDGEALFAIGGYCSGTYLNVVECYNVEADKWEPRTPMDPALSATSGAHCQGWVYVSGGQTHQGISKALWCYNTARDKWESKPSMNQGRMDHSMCCYREELYVVGGYDKNIFKACDLNTVECYNIITEQWHVVAQNTPKLSAIHSSLVDTKLYIVGGFSYDENKKRNEVICFDVRTRKWEVVAKMNTPAMSVAMCALKIPYGMVTDVTV